jgi:hypothetical protein
MIEGRLQTTTNPGEIVEFLQMIAIDMRYKHSAFLSRKACVDLAVQTMRAHGDTRIADEFLNDVLQTGLVMSNDDGIFFSHDVLQDHFARHTKQ